MVGFAQARPSFAKVLVRQVLRNRQQSLVFRFVLGHQFGSKWQRPQWQSFGGTDFSWGDLKVEVNSIVKQAEISLPLQNKCTARFQA